MALSLGAACSSAKEQQAQAQSPVQKTSAENTEPSEQAMEAAAVKDIMTKEGQTSLSPADALIRLEEGNERFLSGEMINRDLAAQVSATGKGQYPHSVVLTCIDSRVPAELIFDQGIGDIFTARVAGNFVNDDILGSMEFATKVAGSKLVVVMGHTSCGAVKGACDNVQLGHISSLVTELKPSVEAVAEQGHECSSDKPKVVNKVAAHNVEHTIAQIRKRSEVMAQLEKDGAIRIVGAMYDVSTGKAEFQ
jgi:carbonic anhydrase